MYPAHTQLLAKWSSPSIGDQRATGWRDEASVEVGCDQGEQIAGVHPPPLTQVGVQVWKKGGGVIKG